MIPRPQFLRGSAAIVALIVATSGFAAEDASIKLGEELAARLRSAAPQAPTETTGVLQVRKKNNAILRSIPIRSKVEPGTNQWQVSYEISGNPTNGIFAERLLILRSVGTPGLYLYSRETAANAGAPTNLPTPVALQELGTSLGDTDFCLGDLGLEFLYWPTQKLVTNEMRRGRSCRVLESSTTTPWVGGYVRVQAWVDVETDGILQAHAFDPNGEMSKEFSVGPVKKIDGRWELQSMKMRSLKTGQSTDLEFNH